MKKIELINTVILHDIEIVDGKEVKHNVTNHPGAVLALPDDEADALIDKGDARDYREPAAEPDTSAPADEKSPAADKPAAEASPAGVGVDAVE